MNNHLKIDIYLNHNKYNNELFEYEYEENY